MSPARPTNPARPAVASSQSGTLITVAPTGAESSKADVPALPVTLDELVSTARDAEAIGASVIHVLNRWDFIVELHNRMRDAEVVPEYEIFDLGQLSTLQRLLDKHGLPYGEHVHVDLVMGVPGGMPGTTHALVAAV